MKAAFLSYNGDASREAFGITFPGRIEGYDESGEKPKPIYRKGGPFEAQVPADLAPQFETEEMKEMGWRVRYEEPEKKAEEPQEKKAAKKKEEKEG